MAKKYVAVTLRGDTALMFNKEQESEPSRDIDPRKLAAKKLHVDGKGKPCIPKLLLMRALIGAGIYVQYHKMRNFTSGKPPNLSSIVTSCVDIVEDHCVISPSTWEVDQQPHNAHTAGKVSRPRGGAVRPRFPRGWSVSFTLEYDTDDPKITEAKVRQLLETAGKKVGIGSYRVENTGWYGKFKVGAWKPLSSFKVLAKDLRKRAV